MKIYVLPEELLSSADDYEKIISDVKRVENSFTSTYNSIDWNIKSKGEISRYVRKLNENFEKAETALKSYKRFVKDAANTYAETEGSLISDNLKFEGIGSSDYKSPSGAVGNIFENEDNRSFFEKFFFGDIKGERNLFEGSLSGKGKFLGRDISGSAEGEFLHGEYHIKNDSSFGDDLKSFSLSTEAGVTGALATGSAKGEWGLVHGSAEGSFLTGTVSGKMEATLYDDGVFRPSIMAEVGAAASVASGSLNLGAGNDTLGYDLDASGDFLHAEMNAKAGAGYLGKDKKGNDQYGVSAEVNAMASLAQGELSGGFTILGVKVGASVKGYAGAVGVEAGGSITTNGAKASLAGAAALGVGVDVSIDWSGFKDWAENASESVSELIDDVSSWWSF